MLCTRLLSRRYASTSTRSPGVSAKAVSVVGAPMQFGQPLPGTEMGPSELRKHGLEDIIKEVGLEVDDRGDIEIQQPEPSDPVSELGGKYTYAVGKSNERLSQVVTDAASHGNFVLTLGGDHSIAMGSVSGILAARPSVGVIWVDAHADLNDPSNSPSGNVHGMPLSFLTRIIDPMQIPGCEWVANTPVLDFQKLVYIGLRDVDEAEKAAIREHDIKAFTMFDVDRYGIGKVMEMALDHVGKDGCPLHLSYDIDAVDPEIAPSTGTKVKGGLNYREAHFVAESIVETGQLGSMDLVEVNPRLTSDVGAMLTVNAGLDLISSALGKRIL